MPPFPRVGRASTAGRAVPIEYITRLRAFATGHKYLFMENYASECRSTGHSPLVGGLSLGVLSQMLA